MASTPPVVGPQLDPRAATTRSTAARLLDGAGRATVVAYREDAGRPHQVLAHGLTPADVLAVALPTACLAEGEGCHEVRLRIDQHGADPRLRVSTASVHTLAHLRLVEDVELGRLAALGLLPTEVGWAAEAGARVALLALDRVLLHDQGGVTPLAFAELVCSDRFPHRSQEWLCHEIAQAVDDPAAVVAQVCAGDRAGVVGQGHPTPASVRPYVGETVLADVDGTGCTWLRIDADRTRTVFVPFDAPVRDLDQLEAAVTGLGQPAV
ncbi:hypothetical protein BJF86_06840 [Serinicoccus sp. CNJ-927]|uniref:hypothetical protein n=1 Tax=Serinicoccus sp. CNJ-927 TaxID=1904970 RepID=UPI00096424F5|nr:hypothetical protein [Serinicoccus sp. CNJ-927]OLT39571.1 hypothetical protein BJF86_06840 [Serinicoccus sp. CNJ-927]